MRELWRGWISHDDWVSPRKSDGIEDVYLAVIQYDTRGCVNNQLII